MLSVVIPVHNEEENVRQLYDEIIKAKQQVPEIWEVVFVDDASTDNTAAMLQAASREEASLPLRIIQHGTRCGQSMAMRNGIRAASGTLIVTLDGDGQNDPANIGDLLKTYRAAIGDAGRGMAIGHRTKRRDTVIRRLSSRIANGIRSRMLGDATPDTGCGLKLFARAFYLELPFFHHQHRFLPALSVREGGSVHSVPVNHRPRARGKSKYGVWNRLWVGIVDLFGVSWLQKRYTAGVIVRELGH